MKEKPYTGLTALVKVNGTKVGYINSVDLTLEKEIVDILQFGAQYKEKVPTIKNWSASSEGTVAFEAGESQEKLYLAYESGEPVELTIQLDEGVYFQGDALISSLNISGAPDDAMNISVEFEGSGAINFVLPQTVDVIVRSGVGGTTNPAGVLRVKKGETLTVKCLPAEGMTSNQFTVNEEGPSPISLNTFTTSALSKDSVINVTFKTTE